MTKTFKSRLFGVLISSLVLLTGFFGVSLGLGDTAKVAFAATNCTYENGFCKTHTSSDDCYYEACTQNSDGYYEIANAGNLFWYAQKVNADNDYYYGRMKGKIIVDAIDLEDRSWMPIGSGKPFRSVFDGNNAVISGLNLTATSNYKGLFANVGGCTIKDLTVKGKIDISATDSTSVNYVGGVIGWGDGGTKLENVTSYVDINDTNSVITSADKQQRIGGVAGHIQSATIKNCNYYGTMTMSMAKYGAGIVGYATSSTIDYCNNYGTITFKGESNHIGGVVGHMENNTNVTCCANYGNVTSGGNDCIGGVVGYILKGTIENCANIGNVNCTYEKGGFVGGILGYVTETANFGAGDFT